MKNKHIIPLLPDYLDGLLSEVDRKMVEIHLEDCALCHSELDDLKQLFYAFKAEEELLPSASLKTKFIAQLEEEMNTETKVISLDPKVVSKPNHWTKQLMKIAASILLLVGAFFLGSQKSQESAKKEIAQLTEETLEIKQTAMISLLENKSASRRIQGVNYLQDSNEPDETVVTALADRMLYDENVNVRAAAVEVLAKFTASEKVKNTFIEALKIEKDPGIQIAIIQTLGQMQEKKAVTPMQQLLENEETQPFVKEQIESVLPHII